jgi:glycosyltransferase involved in cell wall biosynthesis
MNKFNSEHERRGGRPTICLIIEGAYPYIVGGVSVWVHQLISELSDFQFLLWTVVPERDQPYRFELPRNVVGVREVSLADKLRFTPRRRLHKKQWQEIFRFHERLEKGAPEGFDRFCWQFSPDNPRALGPENWFRDLESWQLLRNRYNRNHPVTPFVDYYWGWRAIHIPLFLLMQAKVPEADLYHAISTGYAGMLGAKAKIETGKPFLLTEHGIYAKEREIEVNQSDIFPGYQKRMWKKSFHGLARIAYTYADRIIALFRQNQEIQIQLGAPAEKCMIIPNGVPVKEFLQLKRKTSGNPAVGFIGRIVSIKDIKTFLLGARIIKDRFPDARFYIIGPQDEEPEYYKELLMLVDILELKESAIFTGKVDVKEYLPRLDVLCLTSVKEAQPLSLIEAMLAGVPIVATKVGDVPDILQSDGIVVPPKSPEKLAEGVIKFLTDQPFREGCIQRARERAKEIYDRDRLMNRYRSLYQEYLERREAAWRA